MKQVHLILKELLCLAVTFAMLAPQLAISQPIIASSASPQPRIIDSSSAPIGGVEETPAQKNPISIYPNPASSNITIQSSTPIHFISIVDILGRTIKQIQPNQLQANINLNDVLSGRYFIKIQLQGVGEAIIKSFVKV